MVLFSGKATGIKEKQKGQLPKELSRYCLLFSEQPLEFKAILIGQYFVVKTM